MFREAVLLALPSTLEKAQEAAAGDAHCFLAFRKSGIVQQMRC